MELSATHTGTAITIVDAEGLGVCGLNLHLYLHFNW